MAEQAELLSRLRALDCCALSDALDKLGLKGAVTHLPQQSGAGRIAGRAVTFKVAPGEPPPGPVRHLGTQAIEAAGPDNVIVVEQRSGVEAGCWGGLLTLGAKSRGVAGVVADGPVRDIDEARACQFPIFTNRTTSFTARGRVVEKTFNEPIKIGDVEVAPGDYVAADNSAVIVIKPDNILRVVEAAEAIAARERAMAKAIGEGKSISAVLGGDYEHMLAKE
ncbi:RraA family protein [Hyphococcus luteus]|uniref:Putative 4-hydroxy-4-methyl-2-oxoglutarate aldolase n=1 Tax=Hyphococcus luteus TaxID=2058213 RepID=A0A2S7K573_9PROT|nr:RraA family protein [Marinicaulis flavus]PQA87631.1 dimethylmenaquinone methyltransferase [Marinicaulis flavus]